MKTVDFITKIQGYYDKKYVKGIQLDLITKYLDSKHENYVGCLFNATVKRFSGQYKTLPDIAIFEELITMTYGIIHDQERKKRIQDLKTPSITDDEEVDYSEEMKELFAGMDERFRI